VRSLFVEDRAIHFENLKAFSVPELLGDEWKDSAMPIPAREGRSHAAE
jgi:hypothetical protein